MNFIVVGLTSLVALVVIAMLLVRRMGFKPLRTSAAAKQETAEQKRRNQILKG